MPPLVETGGLISSGLKPRGGGAFGSGGGILPERSTSREASMAACICAGEGRWPESLPTKPSITLRWRSTAARSSALCFDTSMVLLETFASAPRFSNAVIAAARFADAAKISGVCSHSASRALTSALASANRAAAITALLKRGADPNVSSKTIDVSKQGQLDRAAVERQRKVIEGFVGKDSNKRPTPAQMQAAIEASREVLRSGVIPPPDPNAPPPRPGVGVPVPVTDAPPEMLPPA